MMSGRDFALLAEQLAKTKPSKEDSLATWQQYADCVNAVAKACLASNLARFQKHRFIKQCYSGVTHEQASNSENSNGMSRFTTN